MKVAANNTPRRNPTAYNIGCAIIFTFVALLFYFGHRGIWGFGKDVDYVNSIQYQSFDIPREANDICYCFNVVTSTVDIKITRNDFLRWCQTKGWLVREIQEDSPVARPYILPDGLVAHDLCTRGLQFDARHHDGHGFFGAFDEGVGRAGVVWTSGR